LRGHLHHSRSLDLDLDLERLVRSLTNVNANEQPTMDDIPNDSLFADVATAVKQSGKGEGDLEDRD
jgi:hypothetical protein